MAREYFTAVDGTRLARHAWFPQGDLQGVVLLAHGFGEHAGRYERLAASLTQRGFALLALDHRGHGHSEGERAFVAGPELLAGDFLAFAGTVASELPGRQLILFGHSMGGPIAAQAALRQPELFAGLILSAPYLQPGRPAPPLLRIALAALARVLPRAAVERIPPTQLSHIEAEVKAYAEDPLVYHGSVTARSAHSLLAAGTQVLQQATRLTLPLLILHGEADAIAASGGSVGLAAAAAAPDKTLRLFPDGRHELLNDLDSGEFLETIGNWLQSRF